MLKHCRPATQCSQLSVGLRVNQGQSIMVKPVAQRLHVIVTIPGTARRATACSPTHLKVESQCPRDLLNPSGFTMEVHTTDLEVDDSDTIKRFKTL